MHRSPLTLRSIVSRNVMSSHASSSSMLRRSAACVAVMAGSSAASPTSSSSCAGSGSLPLSFVVSSSVRCFADRPATFAEIAESLKVMGVNIRFEDKELKKVYHQLVKKHHPDAGGDEKQMSKVSVAYEKLSNLTQREKEQFENQKGSYTASSGHSQRGGFQSARGGTGAYRRPYEEAPQYENTNFYRNQEYARANAQARAGFYNFRGSGPSSANAGPNPFTQNPFGAQHPFSMGSNFRKFGNMSFNAIMIRGLLLYFLTSLLLAVAYRSYRDWANDDGWKMAESLSRHEQLAELHRIRAELKDKMSNADRQREDAYQRTGDMGFAAPFRRAHAMSNDAERVKELRALEYAQRRQMDMETQAMEMRGWPKFDPSKGALMKLEGDPVGVVHFEPRQASNASGGFNNVASMDQQRAPDAPQGPNNNPNGGASQQHTTALERAMREQQRQQAEMVAAQMAAHPQQVNAHPPQQQGGGFRFQDAFTPNRPTA